MSLSFFRTHHNLFHISEKQACWVESPFVSRHRDHSLIAARYRSMRADTNGADQVKVWKGMLEYLDSTQHVARYAVSLATQPNCSRQVSGILVDLPQPTVDKPVQRPMEASLTCNASAHLVRYAARGGPIIHNAVSIVLRQVSSATP